MQTEMKTEVVLCPNCKEEVPKTLYCLNCGYPLYKMQSSPNCKEEVPKTLYCLNCGYPLYKMQSNPAAKVEEKKVEVLEPETIEPVVEEKTEDTTIDDFSIDNVMDEVEDIGMNPEPVHPAEPTPLEPEPIVAAPEPVTIEVVPVAEDVIIMVEPEPVIEPIAPEPVVVESEPVYEPEPTPVYQPVVIENTPTPIMEIKTEAEPLVVSPEPVYTAPVEPVYEPEPVIEAAPVIEVAPEPVYTAPVEPVYEPEPVIEPEVVTTPEVITEPVVETSNMIEYDPDPAIKELMGNFAKNLSMKIRLVDLLKSGEVKKETFHRLFESYLARGDHLMNSRNEMLERVKYELSSKEKSYNETKKNAEIAYLSDISKILSNEEINELNQKGNNCLEGLDQLAYSNILDPETAGRVRVSLEEAIACLKS